MFFPDGTNAFGEKREHCSLRFMDSAENIAPPATQIKVYLDLFSKKCDISCHKGYTDKNEKQVGCYVNLDGVETFRDT